MLSSGIVRSVNYFIRSTAGIAVKGKMISKCIMCHEQARYFSNITYNFPSNGILSKTKCSISVRKYAKGRDKKKEKGKAKLDESILTGIVDLDKMHKQYGSCVENLKEDYSKNLSLRSTSGSVETLQIKFDGSEYKLQELAQVIRQNTKSIILNMASFPQAIPAVLEAIEKSGMNLNPQQDGTKLFIPVPKVTKELRETLAKNAKAMFIKCRTELKDTQNKYIKNVKNKEKSEGVSADLSRSAAEQITGLCDLYVAQAEKILSAKQAELKGESS